MAVNTHQHGHERMREGLRIDPVIDGCPPFWQPVPTGAR
jgi:hypothetical protein